MQKYDEYKSSGIQWIGDIPSHWEVKKMNYTCSQITDFVASGSFADLKNNVEYLDEPDYAMLVRTADLSCKGNIPPVYVSKESYAFLSNSNLFGGEIILPNIGSVGDVYLVPHDLYPYMTLAPNAIMVNTQCNKFFYYFFSSKCGRDGLADISQGTTQSKFNKTQLRALKVIVPSLVEQEAIVEYLDKKCGSIDTVIATQERRIALLSEMRQSIITEAVTRGINPDAHLKDSGIEWIGEIPSDWGVFPLKRFARMSKGLTYTKEDVVEAGVPAISYGQIHSKANNCLGIQDNLIHFVPDHFAVNSKKSVSHQGDFIFADTSEDYAGCGNCIYNDNDEPIYGGYHTIVLQTVTDNNKYLAYLFKSDCWRSQIRSRVYGVKVYSITQAILSLCSILLPPKEIQQNIVSYLDEKCSSIDSAIGKAKREIELLREFKQSVITEAVTGKIKVY